MKYRFLTRIVITLSVVSLFTDISSEMLYPIMPVFLTSIGFTALWIGMMEGIAEAVVGLSKGYFGKWSDVSGRRLRRYLADPDEALAWSVILISMFAVLRTGSLPC